MPEYRFDRYRMGRKMAEGLVLTKPASVDDAVAVASRLAEPGDVFVLREDLARLAEREAEAAAKELEGLEQRWCCDDRYGSTFHDLWRCVADRAAALRAKGGDHGNH